MRTGRVGTRGPSIRRRVQVALLPAIVALTGLPAIAQAPQVDEILLPGFQAQFERDAGKVRVVLLLAPS